MPGKVDGVMSFRFRSGSQAGFWCCLLLATAMVGCQNKQSSISADEIPGVPVSQPIEKDITDVLDYTGRTDSVEPVDIRARVTGYLMGMPFKEGSEVRVGDLLFEIDHRPYKAQLDQATSQISLSEASYERDRAVALAIKGGVSQQQLDQDLAAVEEAMARVTAFKASTEVFKINVGFTRVTSPIRGQVSRYYLTKGNLVNQDQTLLTTIVSLDPIYAYFDMDEPTYLSIKRGNNGESNPHDKQGGVQVFMGLQGEDGYPHQGSLDFINNQVNPTTGSISVRAVFRNPRPWDEAVNVPSALGHAAAPETRWLPAWTAETIQRPPVGGARLLSPGMFARIRLPMGQPHRALLVNDRAIGSDQGLKFVYVVDADNKLQYRRVETGGLQDDGLRVILPTKKKDEGLRAGDWIAVGNIQQLRPKMEIRRDKLKSMPTLSQPAEATGPDQPDAAKK
jgi:membrane fusion protein, multidrug efflux system